MRLVLLACLMLLPLAAHAQGCFPLMQAFRANLPPVGVPLPPGPQVPGCTALESAGFVANLSAVPASMPATAEALAGTWLGDDVALYLSGQVLAGQEVLEIGPGPEPGSLSVVQYWYRPILGNGVQPWNGSEGYAGRVAAGVLLPLAGGAWAQPDFGPGRFTYGGIAFYDERSEDLWMKDRINHFDRQVRLRAAGDVLVLEAERLEQPGRTPWRSLATYTRVTPEAPDLAIAVSALLEAPMGRVFDCYTHQFSEGAGPVIDALGPGGMEAAAAALLELRLAYERLGALMDAARRGDMPKQEDMAAAVEARQAALARPVIQALDRLARGEAPDGCPSPY